MERTILIMSSNSETERDKEYSRIKVEFEVSNAAFGESRQSLVEEIRRCLEKVTKQIASGYDDGYIMDLNGNTVGDFELLQCDE
tara:strand:- start:1649 stop:1900 length:252 start_codon:yes stop_codon:yes gene_type:complete